MHRPFAVSARPAWLLAAATCLALGAPARAQAPIGDMAVVERAVTGAFGGRSRALSRGDGVVQNEVLRTGSASAARVVFLDSTNLAMGANASVTLDRFVYDGSGTARSAVVNATRGAFRWISGQSPSSAYRINTPLATIGVRGTIFDLLHQAGRSVVVLVEGAVRVCTRAGTTCVDLDRPGEMVVVTARGVSDPRPAGPNDFDFGTVCQSYGESICRFSRAARLPLPDRRGQPTSPQGPFGYDPARSGLGGDGPGPGGGGGGQGGQGGQGSGQGGNSR